MDPFTKSGNPEFAGFYGGGGNRTPDRSKPDRALFQRIRAAATIAWRANEPSVIRFCELVEARAEEFRQGKDTNIYVVFDGLDACKIGHGSNPLARLVNMQVNNPRQLTGYAAFPATDTLERFVHSFLTADQIRGEWFTASPLVLAIADEFRGVGEMCVDMERSLGRADVDDAIQMFVAHAHREEEWSRLGLMGASA